MKFQLKALAAAVVLSASSLTAQAAMDLASSGNGSFVLSVWNADLGSATFDLGYNYDSFAGLVSQGSFDLSAGSYANAWSFISAASSVPTSWAIYAGDNTGSLRTVGTRGFFITANEITNMDQLPTSGDLSTILAPMDTYIGAANNIATGNHSTEADGANTSVLTADSGAGKWYGSGKTAAAGPFSTAKLDESLQMLHILSQGPSPAAPSATFMADGSGNNYKFTLSSAGLLSVSSNVMTPVPEADSYAMLLAGLGVLGLVARRRKA